MIIIIIVLYIISAIVSLLLTRYIIRKNGYSFDFVAILCPLIPIGNIGWSLGILVSLLMDRKITK
jgi:hypothetical protein